MNSKSLLIAMLVGSGAMFAQAYTSVFAGDATFNVKGQSSISYSPVAVSQFDVAGATLNSVTITWRDASISQTDSLYNPAGHDGANKWVITTAEASLSFNDGKTTQSPVTLFATASSPLISVAVGKTVSATLTQGSASSFSTTYLAADGLSAYTGPGTFNLGFLYKASGSTVGLDTEVGDSYVMTDFTGTSHWTVTYDYVPEPASASLLMLGAMAIGLRRRFKKTV